MVESLRIALDVSLAYIPQLIGTIIILIVGYIIARALQAVVSRVLQAIGFDTWMRCGGIRPPQPLRTAALLPFGTLASSGIRGATMAARGAPYRATRRRCACGSAAR